MVFVIRNNQKMGPFENYKLGLNISEPQDDKTNKVSVRPAKTSECAPSKDRVFAVCSAGS